MDMQTQQIEVNQDFRRALRLMEESSSHVFITGKAGTGKSTLLEYFRSQTQKKIAVLAPTGVAALNIQGQTIHSFFGFKTDVTLSKIKPKKQGIRIYKELEAIVIDEISMVRADLLDCVDTFMRLHGPEKQVPFGGVQMIFIGDLYQLPPVVSSQERQAFQSGYKSEYFFDAAVFHDPSYQLELVELHTIYRQQDDTFITLLNAIRNNTITEEMLEQLNTRCIPDFEESEDQLPIVLTPFNAEAERINKLRLDQLPGEPCHFQGVLRGEVSAHVVPTSVDLHLKEQAQVMFVNNDSEGNWVNGTLGRVVEIEEGETDEEPPEILVEREDGLLVDVRPYTWEVIRFFYDQQERQMHSEAIGTFTQYPLRLAWAVTIHKSQGKTFDRVIVDLGRGTFTYGQLYVALSRCTSMEGLVLIRPVKKEHVMVDYRVARFMTDAQYQQAEREFPLRDKIRFLEAAVDKGDPLTITYLKTNDTLTTRKVLPKAVGQMEYRKKEFPGLSARCLLRNQDRIFRIDRIVGIEEKDM
jgi:ATP-dependent exoDNAse (exonuclease V) alpha subunit